MNERMLQRCRTWDYRARGIYMITLTTLNRRPLFGRLVGGEATPAICRSGRCALRCSARAAFYPRRSRGNRSSSWLRHGKVRC